MSAIFIFCWIFKDIVENQDLYSKKDDLKNNNNKKFIRFDIKDFFFISISVKCIFWQILKEIVDNKHLYRKKDDF